MNRKESYRDMEKYRKTHNRQQRRYYGKTGGCGSKPWTARDMDLILRHEKPDHELSRLTGHSVKAIQIKRSRLKKEMAEKQI